MAVVGGDVSPSAVRRCSSAATVRGKSTRRSWSGRTSVSVLAADVEWGGWWPFAEESATVLRRSLVPTISLLLTIVAPGWIRSMGVQASGAELGTSWRDRGRAVRAGPAGRGDWTTISIVGIRLLGAIPFALALGALAWTGGFAAAAISLGARLRGSSVAASSSLVADLVIGFVAISALTMVAHAISFGPGWLTPFDWMSRAGGNRGRVRGVDDRSGRGHLGPVRQIAGDAAACPRRQRSSQQIFHTGEDGGPAVFTLDVRQPRAPSARRSAVWSCKYSSASLNSLNVR